MRIVLLTHILVFNFGPKPHAICLDNTMLETDEDKKKLYHLPLTSVNKIASVFMYAHTSFMVCSSLTQKPRIKESYVII